MRKIKIAKKFVAVGIVGVLMLLQGCASVEKINKDVAKHVLYVESKGKIKDFSNEGGDIGLMSGEKEEEFIDNLISDIKKSNKKVVFFIHGGLNSSSDIIARANSLIPEISKDYYPIFVSWDSAGPDNYFDHLFLVRRGADSRLIAVISSPFVLIEDITRSIARLPASLFYNIWGDYYYDNGLNMDGSNDIYEINKLTKKMKSDNKFNIVEKDCLQEKNKEIIDDIYRLNPVKLVSSPLVTGFGVGAWHNMIKRANSVINKASFNFNDKGKTSVSKLMNRISDEKIKVEALVGHSMGTIVANDILSLFPKMDIDNIVYMASASSLDNAGKSVAQYMRNNKNAKFYSLSLSPWNDIYENNYWDFVPRGSLLVWIDQSFGDINSFRDRTLGFWWNTIRGAEDMFGSEEDDLKRRVNFVEFGQNDGCPQKHGEFDEYVFWKSGFWNGKCSRLNEPVDFPEKNKEFTCKNLKIPPSNNLDGIK